MYALRFNVRFSLHKLQILTASVLQTGRVEEWSSLGTRWSSPENSTCSNVLSSRKILLYRHNTDSFRLQVLQRARTGGWSEKIRLYRDNLAFGPWEKSLETLWDLNQIEQNTGRRSSSATDLFNVGPIGSFKARTTVIWGKGDVAIENSIATDGILDFFGAKPSQLIYLSRVGHWSPVEKQGIPIFEEIIAWAMEGENGSLKDRLGDEYPVARFAVER
jgi:hypothetical protein